MNRTFIIAEAGVNHNGDIELAKKLIDTACEAGVDAVKFQTFVASKAISKNAPTAEYQKKDLKLFKSQLDMIKKLEFSESQFLQLKKYCETKKILFLSTPFDFESIEVLEKLNIKKYKISSGDITNIPFLEKIGSLKKEVILSTGMSKLGEIELAIETIVNAGTLRNNISILHCNSEYPTPFEDVNLKAMLTIKNAFNLPTGYSDHTPGIEIPIAAVALGATIIEKHFTLDKNLPGPDHKASLEPSELINMVRAIRNIEKALGDGIKQPSKSEEKNIIVARKSLVANKEIKIGDFFTAENITLKRPGNGLHPIFFNKLIGKKSTKNYQEDDLIEL